MMGLRSLICSLAASQLISLNANANALVDIYQQAVANDPSFQAAKARNLSADQQANLSRAALLPQLSISGSVSKSEGEATGNTVFSGNLFDNSGSSESDTESYSASLSQTLFDLSAWHSWQQGRALRRAAQATFSKEQQALALRTAEAYFNVLRARDNLTSAQAEERAINQQLEQTRQRFEVGLAAITDVHEAQAAFDGAVAQRLAYEGDLGISFEVLTNLTGSVQKEIHSLKEDFPIQAPEPAAREHWTETALQNSPDLQAAHHAYSAAQQQAKAAARAHLPKVTASASYTDSNTDGERQGSPFDTEDETTLYAINVQMPLYLGGNVHASRKQAHYAALESKALKEATRRNLIQATRSLHLAVNTHIARTKARKQALKSSESALEATKAGYDAGTRNTVDLLVSQQNLHRALRDYANSRYEYVVDLLRLKQTAGVLAASDIEALDNWLNASNSVQPLTPISAN